MDKFELKKLKPILETTYPKVAVHEAVANISESKALVKKIHKHDGDKATLKVGRISVEMERIMAKNKLKLAEDNLVKMRRRTLRKLSVFDEKWKELAEKQRLFKESQVKFDNFVKENLEKRSRAEKKIIDEKALQVQRVAKLMELQETFNYYNGIKGIFEVKIKELKIYDDYLNTVVASSSVLKDTNAVLARYEDLMASKAFVANKYLDVNARLLDLNQALSAILAQKDLEIVGKKHFVTNLQSRFDEAKHKSLVWETVVAEILNIVHSKQREFTTVNRSVHNLFMQTCLRRNVRINLARKLNVEEKLRFIKMTLHSMAMIKKQSIKLFKQEMRTNSNMEKVNSHKLGPKTSKSVQYVLVAETEVQPNAVPDIPSTEIQLTNAQSSSQMI